jgi:hypothetical protein
MTELRDPDPRARDLNRPVEDYDDRYAAAGSSPPWGWIAGAVAVFLVLAVIFTWGGDGSKTTASSPTPPSSTTSMAPPVDPAAPPPVAAPSPRTTTGQGTAQ